MEQKKVDFFDRCRYWEGRLRLDGFPVGNIDGFRFTKKVMNPTAKAGGL